MNSRELEKLEEKISRATEEKAKAEGARSQILSRLKEDFGISSLKEAEELAENLESQINKRGKKLDQLVEEISVKMGDK